MITNSEFISLRKEHMIKTKLKSKVFIPLYDDFVSKHILGNENNIEFSNLFVNDYKLGSSVKRVISGQELTKLNYKNKTYRTDIKLELNDGRILNIEPYTIFNEEALRKSLAYLCRAIGNDIKKNDKYKQIKSHLQFNIVKYNNITKKGYYEYIIGNMETKEAILPDVLKIKIITLLVDQKGGESYNLTKEQMGWLKLMSAETKEEAEEAVKIHPKLGKVVDEMERFVNEELEEIGHIDYFKKYKDEVEYLRKLEKQQEKQKEQEKKEIILTNEKEKSNIIKNMYKAGIDINLIAKITQSNKKYIQKILTL